MGKLKRMDQVKNILETYQDTGSIKGTARRLHISKNTVREYVRRVLSHYDDVSQALDLPQDKLMEVCYEDEDVEAQRLLIFNQQIDYWIPELRRVGVTKKLLWKEYRDVHENGYGYSQFCERLNRAIGSKNLTIKLNHNPGEVMQVDFAGKHMNWVDAKSGEVHKCEILVATMPHTQHSFVIALRSQRVSDFVYGLNQALLFFGRLPKVILSDNLKSYVTRADRYEPEFNALCVQLATHYGIDLQATRVRKPQDKASVERLVTIIYQRIYAPLRDEIFHSIGQLNEAIIEELEVHNNEPYQQRPGCRNSEFTSYEYPLMKDLPPDLFEIKKSTQSKIRRDYHVFIWEEKNYYSVPFQYAGRPSTVVYTSKTVEVFVDNKRVATHTRLLYRDAYRYQTDPAHMPRSHAEWNKARGFNASYYIGLGSKIGPGARWAIEYIIRSATHPPQSFNSCIGIMSLAKKYSEQRLENACLRCQNIDRVSYRMIKTILQKNLDQQDEQGDLFSPPIHKNIRGSEAYQ